VYPKWTDLQIFQVLTNRVTRGHFESRYRLMNKPKKTAFISISLALVAGTALALVLYKASDEFFSAKRQQTLVKTTELGASSSGEVVFPIGAEVPNITFDSISGGVPYDMEADKSSLKIVNFWASWCEPCVEEFSSFARLLGEMNGDVAFVGVSEDKTLTDAKDFLKAFNSDFQSLDHVYFGYDTDKKYSKAYGLLALPETFIVDADNKLLRRISGFERWDTKQAVDYFKKLVQKQKILKKAD